MEVRWLRPLFVNGGGFTVQVGIAVPGHDRWYFLDRDGTAIEAEKHFRVFLPLMQPGYGGDYATARRMIAERLEEAGLPETLVDTFPFRLPVDGADRMQSGFWSELADEWRPHLRR